MVKWEYLRIIQMNNKVVNINGAVAGKVGFTNIKGKDVSDFLAAKGKEGWEAFAVSEGHIYFKRPIE